MSKISKRPTSSMPTEDEDRAITAAARSDPDAITPKQLKAMVPMQPFVAWPRSENKKLLVSVRYSPEVIAYFKSTGEGCNREWMGSFASTSHVTAARDAAYYIEIDPSRNSVLSSQTLTSTGPARGGELAARASAAVTSASVRTTMPSAPKPSATSW